MAVISEIDVKLDSKHRVTVRKPMAEHYRMKQHDDGTLVLEPMELVSREMLSQMEKVVEKVKKGIEGNAVDMDLVASLIEGDDV